MSLIVISKTLGLFLNTLTPDDKYFLLNRKNLPQIMRMQLFKKQNTFSVFFAPLPKLTLNLEYFEERDYPHSLRISETTD